MAARRANTSQRRKVQPKIQRWTSLIASVLVIGLFGGAIVGTYFYLSQPGRMPLRVVEVQGELRHLSHAAIREAAGSVIDGGFFSCDMQKLRNAVLAMPWVADVSIRRVWPDRLNMRVTERVPLARWGDAALVSTGARVFRPQDLAAYQGLISLNGPQGSERRVVAFLETAMQASRVRGLDVAAVELDQRRHWWIRFTDGLTVSLGREQRDVRLAQFLRVYPQLIADATRRPQRVDMRYTHGFAVRWQDAAAETADTNNKPQDKV